ncbi:MAG: hypothetical protein AAFX06_04490 [Planctomycetota bacterium]
MIAIDDLANPASTGRRVWKRLLRHAGKKQCFGVLEPVIRSLTPKIRNRFHSVFADQSLVAPLERKHILVAALNELRDSKDRRHCEHLIDRLGELLYGLTGVTLHILHSGISLVQAMLAKRNFDLHLIHCVSELAAIEPDLVRGLHEPLRKRATWHCKRTHTGSLLLVGRS